MMGELPESSGISKEIGTSVVTMYKGWQSLLRLPWQSRSQWLCKVSTSWEARRESNVKSKHPSSYPCLLQLHPKILHVSSHSRASASVSPRAIYSAEQGHKLTDMVAIKALLGIKEENKSEQKGPQTWRESSRKEDITVCWRKMEEEQLEKN